MGTNIFLLLAQNDKIRLFATPTYGAALNAICADAAIARKAVIPEYLVGVPRGFGMLRLMALRQRNHSARRIINKSCL